MAERLKSASLNEKVAKEMLVNVRQRGRVRNSERGLPREVEDKIGLENRKEGKHREGYIRREEK